MLFLLVLLALGVGCMFFPRTVQSFALKAVNMGITSKSEALKAFVQSKEYLISVRSVGFIALVAALFLAFASLRS